MSQKDKEFQPKSQGGRQKFGAGNKGAKGGFRKPFEGDRRDARRDGGEDRSFRKPFKKPYEARERRADDSRGEGFKKPFVRRDRDAGGDGSFKKPFKKPFDRDDRREGGFKKPFERRERSAGEGDFKKPFRKSFDRDDRGGEGGFKKPFKKSFDRDDRREGGFKKPFERRERSAGGEGDFKKPFRKSFDRDDRGGEGGFKKPFKKPFERRDRDDRGGEGGFKKPFRKSFDRDDRRPGGEGGFKKPFKKDFKPRNDRFEDRPAREERFVPREDVGRKLKSDRPSYGAPSALYLYGIHAVSQALLNPARKHKRLLATESGFESLQEAWGEAQEEGLNLPELITVAKEDIERLLPRDAVHQDILLDSEPLEETFLADILVKAGENAKVLILDQVTDPHNIGAIMRSAAAFGAIAVILQKIHAPEITGVLAKTASGAVEVVPLIRETNLSRTLEQLKENGFFCLGLDERGKRSVSESNTTGKIALVLGAEGAGLRRLVSENCDELVKLPTQAPIASLNVSNAAAVALYEATRK